VLKSTKTPLSHTPIMHPRVLFYFTFIKKSWCAYERS